ncbi:hypothetical protein ACOJUR_12035 [Alicyclobacillus tolerans]|uniref:hypothetical protein n=1 Tax=Alicyclobacillus tolerans TaxID=90970 RepID=UPI003B76F645
MPLYDVSGGTTGSPTDLDQLVDALSGNNDIGTWKTFVQLSPPSAPTVTVNTASGNLTGNYQYALAWETGYWQGPTGSGTLHIQGNTGGGQPSATISPNAQQATIDIPEAPTGVVNVLIYRTKAGGSEFFYLTTVQANTVTSYNDNIPDTDLGSAMPTTNTTGTVADFWQANIGNLNIKNDSNGIVFPNLSSFPAVGPTGAMCIVDSMPYVSDGTAWVDPMINLMQLSTAHGGTADFYGPTTVHGGNSLTVNQLPAPTGLTATNATSGTVGSYIAASTTYTYEITAVSYSGTETNPSASVSVTTGTTAYPINLSWTAGTADVQYYNVYKNGNFLVQLSGTATSYQDTGNTATTSQTPPATNQTGIVTASQFNGSATELGGQPASNYLRTDSGAPNPQTVENAVTFNSPIYQGFGGQYLHNLNVVYPTPTSGYSWHVRSGSDDVLVVYADGSNKTSTFNNTLDDGSGNMNVKGSITANGGIIRTAYSTNANLLFNSTANFGLTGWTVSNPAASGDWGTGSNFGVQDSPYFHCNGNSGQASQLYSQPIYQINPGNSITLSGWVLNLTSNNISGFNIQFYNGSTYISEEGFNIQPGTWWTFGSVTAVAPSGTTNVVVALSTANTQTNANISFTRLKLEVGSSPSLYSNEGDFNQGLYGNLVLSGLNGGTYPSSAASGIWSPASGTFNVSAGTVINVASVPNGAKMFFVEAVSGTSSSENSTWGITTSSGSAWVSSGGVSEGGSYAYPGSSGGISSTSTTGYISGSWYDGSYYANGYFQINNGYLQFVVVGSSASTDAANTIRWAVS